jgi:hypothetical protein
MVEGIYTCSKVCMLPGPPARPSAVPRQLWLARKHRMCLMSMSTTPTGGASMVGSVRVECEGIPAVCCGGWVGRFRQIV